MILLPGLLLLLWGELGRCRGGADGDFTFDGDIRHIAVANGSLYIATEEKLYQLSHDLNLVQSVNLRGVLKSGDEVQFYRVSEPERWNTTFRVNVFLPFVSNGTLISCGMIDHGCGYCEVLDLRNISKVVYREDIQVGPQGRNSSGSVSFLVTVDKGSPRYSAIQEKSDDLKDLCRSDSKIVHLQNTDEKQIGGIFMYNEISSTPEFSTKEALEFVDGFQISSVIYLLSNVPTRNRVRLFWFEGKTSKIQTLQSLRGAVLSVSEDGGGHNRLVASSVIPSGLGSPVLWSGVFSKVSGQTDTELVLFELSPDLSGLTNADPDLYINRAGTELKILKPRAVLFRKNHMTSVLAVRKKTWMVFLIGTRDGQLIKLAVDKDYRTTCPTVLYRANDDRPLFPKILLDQVDRKHVYVPFQKQKPEIFSITPSVVSFYGKNHAVLTGRNLSHVTRVRILTESCSPRDGKRRITLTGSHLDFVDGVTHSHAPQEIKPPGNSNYETLTYDSPAAGRTQKTLNSTVSLKVANQTVSCSTSIAYYPDPEFTSFTSTRIGDDVRIIIEKKADRLEMTTAELTVFGIHGGKPHRCIMVVKETINMCDFFTCDINSTPVTEFEELETKYVHIKYGDRMVRLNLKSPPMNLLMLLVLLLIPIIIITLMIVYRCKQQKFTAEMMEDLEMDSRSGIVWTCSGMQQQETRSEAAVSGTPAAWHGVFHQSCCSPFPNRIHPAVQLCTPPTNPAVRNVCICAWEDRRLIIGTLSQRSAASDAAEWMADLEVHGLAH
ncbi:hypothetical protein INR49_003919 [Caranx melampygus]|nr:hypothetical protein INR49_003919 [Caranx melampygus]